MTKYETFTDYKGQTCDYEAAVMLMNDELREQLHNELAPCHNQAFIEAYAEAHAEKFDGEDWAPYYGGAW